MTTDGFSPMAAWAPAAGGIPRQADELEKQARVDRAVCAVLMSLGQAVSLLQARNDSMALSRLVLALAELGGQAADAAERIEAREVLD